MIKFDLDCKLGTHKVYQTSYDEINRKFVTTGYREEPIMGFLITTKEEVTKETLDELADEIYSEARLVLEGQDEIMVVIDAANLDGHFIHKKEDTIVEFKKGFKREYVSKVEIATMMNGKPDKGPKR